MALLTVAISLRGLEIAAAFGVGIVLTSFASRWIRSTELRFSGFEFVDDDSQEGWNVAATTSFRFCPALARAAFATKKNA